MKLIENLRNNSFFRNFAKTIYCLLIFILQAILHALLTFQFTVLNTHVALVITSFLTALSIYWVFRKKINGSSFLIKLSKLFVVIFVVVEVITLASSLYNKNLGAKRFDYAYGHYLPNYSILILNPVGQNLIKKTYNVLSVSTSYTLESLDDGANVVSFKTFIESEPETCKKQSKANCFLNIYRSKEELLTRSSTYHIIMVAVGAAFIFDERKERLKLDLVKKGNASVDSIYKLVETSNISLSGLLKNLIRLRGKSGLEFKLLYNMELKTSKKFSHTSNRKLEKLISKVLKHKTCENDCRTKVNEIRTENKALQLEIEKLEEISIQREY